MLYSFLQTVNSLLFTSQIYKHVKFSNSAVISWHILPNKNVYFNSKLFLDITYATKSATTLTMIMR
jgi:hypothetical protein